LAREGRGPEKEFPWREREVSWVREPRLEGRVPDRLWEAKLMEVIRLLPSQFTFFHLQVSVLVDQPLGAGFRAARSLDMTAASSAAVKDERARRMKAERQRRVLQ
jgi:hypothetical protein